MATLVLTAAGTAIGGPIGGAIGAALGGALDRRVLFAAPGREGPRLSDLKVQTSAYGTQIPKLFGTMRVAGCVIWATDLIEQRSSEGGGKGTPATTRYSYSASFAVALSTRPILGVRRIWAEGRLLRGAAGDFKASTGFRLYRGTEDQLPDPLIAAAEGIAVAPAHRGIAYAVFENLQLGEFGNRIPSLSFEVIADPQPVPSGRIAEELGGGIVEAEENTRPLDGFSAHGPSTRAVLETLAGATNGWFGATANRVTLRHGAGATVPIDDAAVSRTGGRPNARGDRAIAAADTVPRVLTLTHYDAARDYQTSVQRAVRPGAGAREARQELPAVVDAAAAKALASEALARLDLERERRTVTLSWSAMTVAPGARVAIRGVPGIWRIDRWTLEAMVVRLECVRVASAAVSTTASGGRANGARDQLLGSTVVHAFELPPLDDRLAMTPRLAIAAAGTGSGWRSAALLLSTSGGTQWEPLGTTAYPAVLGSIIEPPRAAAATLEDRISAVEVMLANDDMLLSNADAAALDAGANLAMLGDELIQFGEAEPLGDRRWRLRRLRRGRRGTEAAIGTQAAGDRFTLVPAEALRIVDLPAAAIGSTIDILAQGASDDRAAAVRAEVRGVSLVPPSPVHLSMTVNAEGGGELRWVRRSRAGWRWNDGVDAPLVEESEDYLVEIASGAGQRSLRTFQPIAAISAAERLAGFIATVRQAGTLGLSAPAKIEVPPEGDAL